MVIPGVRDRDRSVKRSLTRPGEREIVEIGKLVQRVGLHVAVMEISGVEEQVGIELPNRVEYRAIEAGAGTGSEGDDQVTSLPARRPDRERVLRLYPTDFRSLKILVKGY